MALAGGGGFDYDFVQKPPPDRLICAICHLPCRDPQLSTCCGNNFCKGDIESFKKASPTLTKNCPVCRAKKFESFVNHQASREVNELKIYCPNRSAGCDWVGEVKQVKTHRENNNGCLFQMLPCPHGCGLEHQRQDLTSHIESQCPCYCQYCRTTADEKAISNQHKEKCNKFPSPCPNKCGEPAIPHEQLAKHREKCPLELVTCSFSDVGCTGKMVRKDIDDHNTNNTDKHLELTRIHMYKMKADSAEAMAASERRYEKLNQTLDEAIKILHTKVTMNEVKTEQDKGKNRLILTIEQKAIEAKREAKTNLSIEADRITSQVRKVQTEVANCTRSNQENANNLTTTKNQFSKQLDAVNCTIQDQIKQHKSVLTVKNFVLIVIVVLTTIIVTAISEFDTIKQ